jgi:hypothetical protein
VGFEQTYDPLMADHAFPQVIGRWWNGHWGTMRKRDISLTREPDGTLTVRWWDCRGDIGSQTFTAEQYAEADVLRRWLITQDGGDWVDLTQAVEEAARVAAEKTADHR